MRLFLYTISCKTPVAPLTKPADNLTLPVSNIFAFTHRNRLASSPLETLLEKMSSTSVVGLNKGDWFWIFLMKHELCLCASEFVVYKCIQWIYLNPCSFHCADANKYLLNFILSNNQSCSVFFHPLNVAGNGKIWLCQDHLDQFFYFLLITPPYQIYGTTKYH